MFNKDPAGPDGQLSASCIKALVALSISLSCWFKICMRQHLFPINRESAREWWRQNKDEEHRRKKTDKNVVEKQRQRMKRRDKEKREHSSELIGEFVRLMGGKKDVTERGQLIRIKPSWSQASFKLQLVNSSTSLQRFLSATALWENTSAKQNSCCCFSFNTNKSNIISAPSWIANIVNSNMQMFRIHSIPLHKSKFLGKPKEPCSSKNLNTVFFSFDLYPWKLSYKTCFQEKKRWD